MEGGDPASVNLRDDQDRHLIVVDRDRRHLYELWNVWYDSGHAQWYAGSGAFFDMNTNNRRPETWTSADAAGLAILPGLVRYDEVFASDPIGTYEIPHAFRVTVRGTNGHVFPASHTAGSTPGALPMGARLRLRANKDLSGFPPEIRRIFQAMKKRGLIVADNGTDMFVTGTYDPRWDNDVLSPAFGQLNACDFEVVQLGWKPAQPGGGSQTATHDFNGNGKSDILWRKTDGTTTAWLMNRAQVSQSGSLGVVSPNWQIVGQRDFNGDGKHDLLWRDAITGTVAIWLLNGLLVAQSGSLGAVASNWTIAGTSDFNGDGKADILWRDNTTGTVGIWLLNGLQILQSGNLAAVPNNWVIVGADGQGHIFWRDSTTGTVAIWAVSGLQVTQSASLGAVSANWTIAGTGDFNGDGNTDILWRDSTTGTVAIWVLNGLQVAQSGSAGAVPSNWTIAETGDFDGDGRSDILWRDSTTGTVAIWFMNGLQVSSSAAVGTVGSDWTIQGRNAE